MDSELARHCHCCDFIFYGVPLIFTCEKCKLDHCHNCIKRKNKQDICKKCRDEEKINSKLENALKIVESLSDKDKGKLLKIVIDDSDIARIHVEYCENCYTISQGNYVRNYGDSEKYDSCKICKKTFCNDCIENSPPTVISSCKECGDLYCQDHLENMRGDIYCKKCVQDTDFICSICKNIISCKCCVFSCNKCESIFCKNCDKMTLHEGSCIECKIKGKNKTE